MPEELKTNERPLPTCQKCWADMEPPIRPNQKYCSDTCSSTARSRRKRGKPVGDARLEIDAVLADRNVLLRELNRIAPELEKAQASLSKRVNENRRHRYIADTADTKADKKIAHHGAAIVTAQQHAEKAEQVALGIMAETTRLRNENAVLRDRLRKSLTTIETLGKRPPAKPKIQRTLATQVYFAFHQLAKDYREMRRGTELDDADYRLFEHAARNRARLKLNGTDIDQRTLYYFTRLTTAAYQRGKQQNHQDANTANNVKLYNVVSKLVAIPKGIRPFGETTRIPEPTTTSTQPE